MEEVARRLDASSRPGARDVKELGSGYEPGHEGRQILAVAIVRPLVTSFSYVLLLDVSTAEADDYDALVLPGGVGNADAIRMDADAIAFARAFFAAHDPRLRHLPRRVDPGGRRCAPRAQDHELPSNVRLANSEIQVLCCR